MTPPPTHLDFDQDGVRKSWYAFTPDTLRDAMHVMFAAAVTMIQHGGVVITVRPADEIRWGQKKRMNGLCGDLAKQVIWHGMRLSKDDWRHMMVAGHRKDQRQVPGVEGGFVMLGGSSRDLTRNEADEVIELILAFGSARNVKWTEKPLKPDGWT